MPYLLTCVFLKSWRICFRLTFNDVMTWPRMTWLTNQKSTRAERRKRLEPVTAVTHRSRIKADVGEWAVSTSDNWEEGRCDPCDSFCHVLLLFLIAYRKLNGVLWKSCFSKIYTVMKILYCCLTILISFVCNVAPVLCVVLFLFLLVIQSRGRVKIQRADAILWWK